MKVNAEAQAWKASLMIVADALCIDIHALPDDAEGIGQYLAQKIHARHVVIRPIVSDAEIERFKEILRRERSHLILQVPADAEDMLITAPVAQEPVAYGVLAANTGRLCQLELAEDYEDAGLGEIRPDLVIPLYAAPVAAQASGQQLDRDMVIEECARIADRTPAVAMTTKDIWRHVEAAADEIAAAIRALKSGDARAAAKEKS
ncbi:hypothetical protein FMZ60_08560 [Alcaligenaceae bacterium SJ-26]|nr:hypothetical protein FMZ60_08560 [Alcaligenaceae bacterium SJ-26]